MIFWRQIKALTSIDGVGGRETERDPWPGQMCATTLPTRRYLQRTHDPYLRGAKVCYGLFRGSQSACPCSY